jgi:hypothetical protein
MPESERLFIWRGGGGDDESVGEPLKINGQPMEGERPVSSAGGGWCVPRSAGDQAASGRTMSASVLAGMLLAIPASASPNRARG